MPIVMQYISGGIEHQHSLNELHQFHAFPNLVPSVVHNVSSPDGTPVVDTSAVPSMATSHDSNAAVSSRSRGYMHQPARSVMLDFQAGVIRHQMTVDHEGFGNADDVPARVVTVGLSAEGITSIARGSRKRK